MKQLFWKTAAVAAALCLHPGAGVLAQTPQAPAIGLVEVAAVPGAEILSIPLDPPPLVPNSPPLPAPRDDAPAEFGWSGALRTILSEAAIPLDHALLPEDPGISAPGHRWIPIHAGPPTGHVLGEPVYDVIGFDYGEIRTPEQPGIWLLEREESPPLHLVTRVPASMQTGETLNGYRIGFYPTAGSDRLDAYAPPTAFIEVTPENQHFHVSEHLTLAQFLTKDQFDVWPKYLALDLRLVDKLELVIQELNSMGVRADRMHVMSGFRTPQYNGPGGDGRAALSRHMWGDAADVWIDNDGNGIMDDLNGDGRIDLDDAAVMMRAVERVEAEFPELVGGAGTYPTTSAHGPFIHIDARGQRSRW